MLNVSEGMIKSLEMRRRNCRGLEGYLEVLLTGGEETKGAVAGGLLVEWSGEEGGGVLIKREAAASVEVCKSGCCTSETSRINKSGNQRKWNC